jgi:hypothetical protein
VEGSVPFAPSTWILPSSHMSTNATSTRSRVQPVGEDSVMAVGDDGEVLIEGMKEPCLLCLLSSRVNRHSHLPLGSYHLHTCPLTQPVQGAEFNLCTLPGLSMESSEIGRVQKP